MPHEVAPKDRAIVLFESEEEDPWHVAEMHELASSAGVHVIDDFYARTRRRHGQDVISKDRMEELYNIVIANDANAVLVAQDLSPSDHGELQKEVAVRVVDRTQLILDIFARRAHTREGKLQVELAQLTYLLPRLMNLYTKFERQQGGIGVRGGAGETKLETDRRKVRDRIRDLGEALAEVISQRQQQR